MTPKLTSWVKEMFCVQVTTKISNLTGPGSLKACRPVAAKNWFGSAQVCPRVNFIHALLCNGDVIFQVPYHNLAVHTYDHEARMSTRCSKVKHKTGSTGGQGCWAHWWAGVLGLGSVDFKPDVLNRLTIVSFPFLKGTMQLRI